MTREEIMQALSVAIEYLVAREGASQLILASLLQQAASLGIRTVKDGTNLDGFLALCGAAFEAELKKYEALKGGS
ncbi:MAG: hypothetical protein ACRD1X_13565 [Vicinamibacteria bacterium]